ncbi:hypothetical protein MR626_02460 [bacterium]|nr:hypothetical protein [bacterium]
MAKRRRKIDSEFKPDPRSATVFKTLRLTRLQQLRLLKWGLYILTILLALVVQDVIMSRVRLLGATTDLTVCAILLIAVIEGTEVGSLFLLITSTLYFFSGSAPGAYSIGLMTFFGVAAVIFRQMYLSRSRGSIVLCAGAAQMAYELGLYAVGLFLGLTRWDRIGSFVLTGVYTVLLMIPLYPLICKIGLIGGNTWKE